MRQTEFPEEYDESKIDPDAEPKPEFELEIKIIEP